MKMDNKLTTEIEIRNEILRKVKESTSIKISSIATRCADENMFFRVLEYLESKGLVRTDGIFIFFP